VRTYVAALKAHGGKGPSKKVPQKDIPLLPSDVIFNTDVDTEGSLFIMLSRLAVGPSGDWKTDSFLRQLARDICEDWKLITAKKHADKRLHSKFLQRPLNGPEREKGGLQKAIVDRLKVLDDDLRARWFKQQFNKKKK
jgi:hypothetical protein